MDFKGNHKNINDLSRNDDSVGLSYFRCNEGVPFKWEMQPGIPKHPQQHHLQHIPPLTPPPAILSSNLPRPSISHHHHLISNKPSSSNWSTRLRFWKRNVTGEATSMLRKQSRLSKKVIRDSSVEDAIFARSECFSSDRESVAMSSLPFDSSFSVFHSCSSSRSQSPTGRGIYGKSLSCFPMHYSIKNPGFHGKARLTL